MIGNKLLQYSIHSTVDYSIPEYGIYSRLNTTLIQLIDTDI